MRLLIVTQSVDVNDPALGFFVSWIEEFSKHCKHLEIICLSAGNYNLPSNVRVHSLGKGSRGNSRITYVLRFFKLIWELRHNYDVVFVHMNPEYVALAGLPWRLWGKRVWLWYTHKHVDIKLLFAATLAHGIFTASKESFRLASKKVNIMGHGIDTEFFFPVSGTKRGDWVLSVGRLMPSKRHKLAISAAALAGKEIRVIGEGPDRCGLEAFAKEIKTRVIFLGGLPQTLLRDEYRKAFALIHTSETGSLDKVVLEALATNTPVITTSEAYGGLPVQTVLATSEAITEAIKNCRSPQSAELIVREHSLKRLIRSILGILAV